MSKAHVIAFYLPQFHPTPDNDKWWGKGFTEWTNVGKARPLFPGHYQPRIPADLGYYDLRLPIVREEQVDLARRSGIEAFCYYHYWFGEGKQELDYPFKEVLKLGKPDFPFCLCWANKSWHAKFWNKNGGCTKKMLIEQRYLGIEDYKLHFYSLLSAFKDCRYYKIDDRPVFMIYRPLEFPDVVNFITVWRKLAKENSMRDFYFMAQTTMRADIDKILSLGFDAVNYVGLWEWKTENRILNKIKRRFYSDILHMPYIHKYSDMVKKLSMINREYEDSKVFPTIIPNWDHTPRSGRGGYILHGSTPQLFSNHVKSIFDNIKVKPVEKRYVFLKSWNEWGEGNYMEPDLKFGDNYINVLSKELRNEE